MSVQEFTPKEAFERKVKNIYDENALDIDAPLIETDNSWEIERQELAELKAWYEDAFKNMKNGTIRDMVDIYVGFVDNYDINAFADEHSGEIGFIGIWRGCYHTLNYVFARMLADRNVLSRIGDSLLERDDLPKINIFAKVPSERTNRSIKDLIEPQDITRIFYAKLLVFIAMEFIMMHEYAHIRNGHCALVDEQSNSLFSATDDHAINEASIASYLVDGGNGIDYGPDGEKMFAQTLELDADSAAITFCIKQCYRLITSPTLLGKWQWVHENSELALFTRLFAIGTVATLFGLSWPKLDIKNMKHPPGAFRLAYILSLGKEAWLNEKAKNSEKSEDLAAFGDLYDTVMSNVISSLEASFRSIADSDLGLSPEGGLSVALDEMGKQHLTKLREYWSHVVRSQLALIARDNLAE